MYQRLKKFFLFLTIIALTTACGDDEQPNRAPTISAQSFSASEAITTADVIGMITANDLDEDDLTFSISTNDNNLFTVTAGDATTQGGQLSLNSGQNLDFETATTHTIMVRVSDGQLDATAAITITVIDVDENTMPTIVDQEFTVAEDISDATVIGTVTATDAEGDALTFSITTNSSDLFEISTAGELSLASGLNLDFETATSHAITIQVSDGSLTSTATITITVTDVAENTAPAIADQSFTVAEDIDATTAIGMVTATDAEGNTITYSITTNDNGLFEITTGGELTLVSGQNLDFETSTSHSITVQATDGGLSNTATITINVTDVDESIPSANYTVSTFAGSTQGLLDGQGTAALFDNPTGLEVDAAGNVYVADSGNRRIRKIDPNGNVTTIAGSGGSVITDGQGVNASFSFPNALAVNSAGTIFVSDNNAIRAIDSNNNVITLAGTGIIGFNDGLGTAALFKGNKGLDIDASGNLIIADERNQRIRKIDNAGNVTTIAGSGAQGRTDGNGTGATFRNPSDIAVDANGNIFVVDNSNDLIRKIDPSGNVTTIAGSSQGYADGQGTNTKFNLPNGITIDANGNLYVTDTNNIAIRRIDPNGNVITIAGGNLTGVGTNDGAGNVANFNLTQGIAVDANGVIYVADPRNHRIRKIVFND